MPERPNILILMPDQLRADCLSCAGHPVVTTPNLDRLAAEGVRFDRAYTPCPICMPARSSFLSGLFCHNHGQWSNYGRLPAGADTYARRLRAVGYRTCHIGKSHLHPHYKGRHLREAEPFMRALGWDDILEITGPLATRQTDSILTDHWEKKGLLNTFRDDYARRAQHQPHAVAAAWPSPLPPGETMDDFVGRTACDWLAGYQRAEPWLAFVGFGGPHDPWDPPADWAARYEGRSMNPAQPSPPPEPWLSPAAAAHREGLRRHEHELAPELVSRIRGLYYAKVSHMDDWVGRILDTLDRRGWAGNTLVVFWSDHGEMLGDRNRYHKSVFFEPSARVPLILRFPGRAHAGAVRRHLVSLVDVFPTLLEAAGCEPRRHEFGRSLFAPAADPEAAHHDAVFSEIDRRTMVRDDRFKLVVDQTGEPLKLYDLAEDPGETRNLAGKPEAAGEIRRLQHRLLRWLLETPTDWHQIEGNG
jgi:arylsulfatase A-like enzyme